jgi:hypothetical protein
VNEAEEKLPILFVQFSDIMSVRICDVVMTERKEAGKMLTETNISSTNQSSCTKYPRLAKWRALLSGQIKEKGLMVIWPP